MGWARAEAPAAQLVTPLELLRDRWVEPANGARAAPIVFGIAVEGGRCGPVSVEARLG